MEGGLILDILIVIDMQKDFIDGSLGTKDAVEIVPNVCEKIRSFNGEIIATMDTHDDKYLETNEGKNLPIPHCIKGTTGWFLDERVKAELDKKKYSVIEKPSFGSIELAEEVKKIVEKNQDISIELVGLCTDICVVSNAIILKTYFPEIPIKVISDCCAGVTVETHKSALSTMEMCHITIV